MIDAIRDFRLAYLRGKAAHLRALADDYEAQAKQCRADAALVERRVIQAECRRLLTRQAVKEM